MVNTKICISWVVFLISWRTLQCLWKNWLLCRSLDWSWPLILTEGCCLKMLGRECILVLRSSSNIKLCRLLKSAYRMVYFKIINTCQGSSSCCWHLHRLWLSLLLLQESWLFQQWPGFTLHDPWSCSCSNTWLSQLLIWGNRHLDFTLFLIFISSSYYVFIYICHVLIGHIAVVVDVTDLLLKLRFWSLWIVKTLHEPFFATSCASFSVQDCTSSHRTHLAS